MQGTGKKRHNVVSLPGQWNESRKAPISDWNQRKKKDASGCASSILTIIAICIDLFNFRFSKTRKISMP